MAYHITMVDTFGRYFPEFLTVPAVPRDMIIREIKFFDFQCPEEKEKLEEKYGIKKRNHTVLYS